jgi:uncharacterized protein YbbK (DUF523 family)
MCEDTENELTGKNTPPKMSVIASQCLRGVTCGYENEASDRLLDDALCASLGLNCVAEACPEVLGGLPVPRDRMEIKGGDGFDVLHGNAVVVTRAGKDVTGMMLKGAQETLKIVKEAHVHLMVTRRRSPSCSCNEVFDGTFSRRRRPGVGVTTAYLRENQVETVELEQLVIPRFKEALLEIHRIYLASASWVEALDRSASLLSRSLDLTHVEPWRDILAESFQEMIPLLNQAKGETNGDLRGDSDTVRFYREVFRKTYHVDLSDNESRCRICTYPEGFLDSHIGEDGICSSCKAYQKFEQKYPDLVGLQKLLKTRLDEAGRFSEVQALAACSGGKDSTYMLYRLKKHYGANVLSVMDDLGQQNELAVHNFFRSAEILGFEVVHLLPLPEEKEIRRNFMRSGNSFCRLCLRSHFVRTYQVALERRIPYVLYGLSPYQCLDCVDAIAWTERAIQELSVPFGQQNKRELLQRNEHRAFQGGFDVGFRTANELALLQKWHEVFHPSELDFVPLILPFYIFDGYPERDIQMQTIEKEAGWKKPEVILDRTNCKHLRAAGIMHRAVGRYHLNYKERATALRMAGKVLSDEEARRLGELLENQGDNAEKMTRREFEDYLSREFDISTTELPLEVQERLNMILS